MILTEPAADAAAFGAGAAFGAAGATALGAAGALATAPVEVPFSTVTCYTLQFTVIV